VWKAQERKAAEEIKMMVVVVAITKLLRNGLVSEEHGVCVPNSNQGSASLEDIRSSA